MRVFVTGASGYVGTAVVAELIRSGHVVTGLARSEASAAALVAAGAEVRRGSLDDLDSLRDGAADADAVIHAAFKHNFDDYLAAADSDRVAIAALGEPLVGTGRPLIVTSGTAVLPPGRLGTETDDGVATAPRIASEQAALPFAERGVRVTVLRLPPTVHSSADKHGFLSTMIDADRKAGTAGYLGDGENRWPAVHRLDAARLYRLVLESDDPGLRVHAVADDGVRLRDIAEVIGAHLSLPVATVAADHFGWLGQFAGLDVPASSELTRRRLRWTPSQVGLLADLDEGHYFAEARV